MTRLEALQTLAADPLLPWLIIALCGARILWRRREAIVATSRKVAAKVRDFAVSHNPAGKVSLPSVETVLLAGCVLVLASQRGCIKIPSLPSLPSIPVVNPVDPNSVPVSFQDFRVILVEETSDKSREVTTTLSATPAVSAYLNAKCGTTGWRKWDLTDHDKWIANVPVEFREMLAAPRPLPPCVVIAAKGRAVAKPIPADTTPEAFIELLKPYGGEL